MSLNDGIYLLAIRGTLNQTKLDEARQIHNQTAGNPQGVAAARALGDLSHNVYVPIGDAPDVASELLILDTWTSVEGLGKFFSDPQVQHGGGLIFKTRDPVVWTASGIRGHYLQAPKDKPARFVGLIRGTLRSKAQAREVLDGYGERAQAKARMLGQVSHQLFFRAPEPGKPESMEVFGVDHWYDGEGMAQFYKDSERFEIFTGPPATSQWKQPAGHWVEW